MKISTKLDSCMKIFSVSIVGTAGMTITDDSCTIVHWWDDATVYVASRWSGLDDGVAPKAPLNWVWI